MTDPIAVPDLLARIEKWQDDYAYHPASYHDAGVLLDACRIVLGQQQAQIVRDDATRIEQCLRIGQILGKEYSGFTMEEVAIEFVKLKLELLALKEYRE